MSHLFNKEFFETLVRRYDFIHAHVRLYERLGFIREGAYRENVFAMGRRWDELVYSMLSDEYEAIYGGEN